MTIADDEHVPVNLAWSNTAVTVSEGSSTATLKATATVAEDQTLRFTLTREGVNDYTRLAITETFLHRDFKRVTFDGQRRYQVDKEFTVTVIGDGNSESNGQSSVGLSSGGSTHTNLSLGYGDAKVWIIEDDATVADWECRAIGRRAVFSRAPH